MSAVEENLLKVTSAIEQHVDAVIEQIDNLDVNDLQQLRASRIKELQKQEEQKKIWLSNDHGKYEELPEEKMFFDVIKKSKNVVLHFYTNTSPRKNLKIKTIPTIALIQNSIMVDKIIGFTELGNKDDFTTEMLEWRIAQNSVIDYDGDTSCPPDAKPKMPKNDKKIRDGVHNREDDLDIEEYGFSRDDVKSECSMKNLSPELTPEEAAELGLD
ncbi:hypothetical protein NQ315_005989 [Exocentrus adspersus]|uniref:Thioredoxin domain-containing protein 9 n=1 Tax=Exocentrus adspersus TaxID=1586481 RepID=A0AAV8VC10_9CUCU|nr:hypothetical protein NQ315_005989 [Exocentrus adspersus]